MPKSDLPRVELSPPRERRVGLYTMVYENLIKCGQMIYKSAAQGVEADGFVTIFEKMEVFWTLYRAEVGIVVSEYGVRGLGARQLDSTVPMER